MTSVDLVKLHRPQFLIAGLALNVLGTTVALHFGSAMDWMRFVLFQMVVTSSQLAGACANELADIGSDRLNHNRTWFSGGSGIIASGRIGEKTVISALVCWTVLAFAGALSIAIFFDAGIVSLLLMLGGIALALSYSLRPLKLSYRGFGEVAMAFMVSFLTPTVSFYVMFGEFENMIVLVTVPLVFQMLGLMMVVEHPDREADLAAGKRNLVVRLGAGRSWMAGVLMLAFGGIVALLSSAMGLPSEAAAISGTFLLVEALVFWMLGRGSESESKTFWSTAISCGFYVLVILALAVTITPRP